MEERPILILALRRVGGTSLVKFLSNISAYETLEHEPFNADRSLGAITRSFQENGDARKAKDAIKAALGQPVVIKHCIDTVPQTITRAVIECCDELNYRFIWLTRNDETARLLSLLLAQQTDMWDEDGLEKIYSAVVDGRLEMKPFDLGYLLEQREGDRQSMQFTLDVLHERSIVFEKIIFEDFYRDAASTVANAISLANRIAIKIDANDSRLSILASQRRRLSSLLLEKVPNVSAAKSILNQTGSS